MAPFSCRAVRHGHILGTRRISDKPVRRECRQQARQCRITPLGAGHGGFGHGWRGVPNAKAGVQSDGVGCAPDGDGGCLKCPGIIQTRDEKVGPGVATAFRAAVVSRVPTPGLGGVRVQWRYRRNQPSIRSQLICVWEGTDRNGVARLRDRVRHIAVVVDESTHWPGDAANRRGHGRAAVKVIPAHRQPVRRVELQANTRRAATTATRAVDRISEDAYADAGAANGITDEYPIEWLRVRSEVARGVTADSDIRHHVDMDIAAIADARAPVVVATIIRDNDAIVPSVSIDAVGFNAGAANIMYDVI